MQSSMDRVEFGSIQGAELGSRHLGVHGRRAAVQCLDSTSHRCSSFHFQPFEGKVEVSWRDPGEGPVDDG